MKFLGAIPAFKISVAAICFVAAAQSQTFTGAVVGHVVDPQHAVIADATVTLSSVSRGYARTTTTNSQGEYSFLLVPPGEFTLDVEASGFATATTQVEVVVATPVRADLTVNLEPLRQEVQVIGEHGVVVQTENAALGLTISPREMADLPSLTRSPYDFVSLVPGAVLSNDLLGVGIAINGGRTQSANYLLDGSENNDMFMSAPALDVPLDSVEEFSLQTNHYSAEYGRNSGMIANVITKSGTNSFHGSLYDYVRNSVFAANTWDNKAYGLPRPVFNRHQFGGSLGGPIRQKQLFFFASLEPILVRSSTTATFFVPTPQLFAISAPGTQAIFQRFPLPADLSATNVQTRTLCPFGSRCDPQTGSGTVTIPAFAFTSRVGPRDAGAGVPQDSFLASGRLDSAINKQIQAFVRYGFQDKDEFGAVLQPYSSELDVPATGWNENIALNITGLWSPRFATETRIVYSRVFGDPDRFTGIYKTVPQPPIPAFSISNEPDVVLPSGSEQFRGPQNSYQFYQTVTLARDSHTLKFGAQFVHVRDNRTYGIGEVGYATFSDAQDLVNGVMSSYEIAIDPRDRFPGDLVAPPFGAPSFTRHFHYNDVGLFVADSWKASPRLTVTPGLRWEYFGVLHSPGAEHKLDSNFYPGAGSNHLEEIANGRFLRTIDAPGDLRGRFYLPDYRCFAPRLGLAYDLFGDGKTVIRGGAGIFYDRRVGWELFRAFLNPPNYSLVNLKNVPITPELLTDQYAVFPNNPIQLSQSDSKPIATNLRTAYSLSWNATIEREIGGKLVAGASYVGSHGVHLYSTDDFSRPGSGGLLDPGCVTTRYAADGTTAIGPDYTNCPGLNSNVSDLFVRGDTDDSSFAALQARLDSRRLMASGLEFGFNYSWSHSIDNSSISGTSGFRGGQGSGHLDAFNPGLDRGPSDFDVRHRIVAHWTWELPWGRTSQYRKWRYLFGGWGISGLLSYQTGQPFTVIDSGVPDSAFTDVNTRPRQTGTLPRPSAFVPDAVAPNIFLYLPINQVYDPNGACIANAAPFACQISVNGPFANTLPRNTFRQPGAYYQNMAVMKSFPLPKEGMDLQVRAECYNVFNHPNLYINAGTNDVNAASFNRSSGHMIPGVTVSFADSRQIVLALKLTF